MTLIRTASAKETHLPSALGLTIIMKTESKDAGPLMRVISHQERNVDKLAGKK
jgi:hypothetical protein